MALFRSLLFVPGNNARRVAKALEAPADVVILDLEDACPIAQKIETRAVIVQALQAARRPLGYVRVNALSTEFGYGDLCAVVQRGVDGVMLTKVDGPDQIKIADWLMTQLERDRGLAQGSVDLLPLIETAAGLANAQAIASASKRIRRLAFGAGDFTADLGMRWTREEYELLSFRSALTLASRAAGVEPPIDVAWLNVQDSEGLANSIRWARTLGFQGKLCIHPDHIALINAAFTPSAEEIARAQRIVDAFATAEASGSAAIAVDGALVDYAIVLQARRTLQAAAAANVG